MYAHVDGGIECCACRFAADVKSIFTDGADEKHLLGKIDPCGCDGKGCSKCMMPGSITFKTYDEAIEHLQKHRDNGDKVPEYAFEGLRRDRDEGESLDAVYCECGEIAMVFSFDGTPPKCVDCSFKED